MQTYTGTKTLLASPMTRLEYNLYRGWVLPENENPEDPGYLVEYLDGGKPNDPRHKGYISWSPKDVFDRTYHRTDRSTVDRAASCSSCIHSHTARSAEPCDRCNDGNQYEKRTPQAIGSASCERAALLDAQAKLSHAATGGKAQAQREPDFSGTIELPSDDPTDEELLEAVRPLLESMGIDPSTAVIVREDFGAQADPFYVFKSLAEPKAEAQRFMDFGSAIDAMKQGHAVARSGWNGKGMFLYLVGSGNYPAKSRVAKAHWGEEALIPYAPYIAMKTVDGTVVPWLASQTDVLAEDWNLVEV